MRKILLVILSIILCLSTLVLPTLAVNIDWEYEISSFEETPFNCTEIEIGKTGKVDHSDFCDPGNPGYSSDESVATIDEEGNVTGINEGIAYIATPFGNTWHMHKVTVVQPGTTARFDWEKEIEVFVPSHSNVVGVEVGKTTKDIDGYNFLSSGTNNKCVSYDPNIASVDDQGYVTGVKEGVTYVAVITDATYFITKVTVVTEGKSTNVYEEIFSNQVNQAASILGNEIPNIIDNQNDDTTADFSDNYLSDDKSNDNSVFSGFNIFFSIFMALFIAIFALGIYNTISMLALSAKGTQKKVLPHPRTTNRTDTIPTPVAETCVKCGTSFNGANYCPNCGESNSVYKEYTFDISKRMPVHKFEEMINLWLAENPYIYGCKLDLDTKQSLWSILPKRRFFVKKATIKYLVADKPQKSQYGFAFAYKLKIFTLRYSYEKFIDAWKQNNPDCEIKSKDTGRIHHWDSNGSSYSQYYSYIFFKKHK